MLGQVSVTHEGRTDTLPHARRLGDAVGSATATKGFDLQTMFSAVEVEYRRVVFHNI